MGLYEKYKIKRIAKLSRIAAKEEKRGKLREVEQSQLSRISKAKATGRPKGNSGFGKFMGGLQSYATKLDQKHSNTGFNFGTQPKKKKGNNIFEF